MNIYLYDCFYLFDSGLGQEHWSICCNSQLQKFPMPIEIINMCPIADWALSIAERQSTGLGPNQKRTSNIYLPTCHCVFECTHIFMIIDIVVVIFYDSKRSEAKMKSNNYFIIQVSNVQMRNMRSHFFSLFASNWKK